MNGLKHITTLHLALWRLLMPRELPLPVLPLLLLLPAALAHAKTLETARALDERVSRMSPGGLRVLGEHVNEALFTDDDAVARLEFVLLSVLRSKDIRTADDLGMAVVLGMDVANDPEHKFDPAKFREARKSFCLLTRSPWNLFNPKIAEGLCEATKEKADAPAK